MLREFDTDVLVVGGGMAGCLAAIKAREGLADVTLVDKAHVGKTGLSTFANGSIAWWTPHDNVNDWVKGFVKLGERLNSPEWVRYILRNGHEIVMEMEKWGVPFEKDTEGKMRRFPPSTSRGGVTYTVASLGYKTMQTLRSVALNRGIKVLDRVVITDLLTSDGRLPTKARVVGVAGFDARTGEFCVVKSKATVLCAGTVTYKGPYFGEHMTCGDGYAVAYRAGAELANFEFANEYNTTHEDFPIYGMGRFQGYGGRFINGVGEEFMARYDPVLKDRATLTVLCRAMAKEVMDGRGPIYFDGSRISPEDQAFIRRMDPMAMKAFDRAEVDPFKDKMRWMPAISMASRSGTKVNRDFSTTLQGLFSAGDNASKLPFVGTGHAEGAMLLWCIVSGYISGQRAAEYAFKAQEPIILKKQIITLKERAYAPIGRNAGVNPDEAIYKIQEATFPAKYMIIRHGDRLKEALDKILNIRTKLIIKLQATDFHELVKCHEAESMALCAEMTYKAALMRTESRGANFREDYPERDDRNWLKQICIKREAHDQMKLWTEPLSYVR